MTSPARSGATARRHRLGPAIFLGLALAPGAALAQYLPTPDPVPDALEGPCREALEARYQEIEAERRFLDPQIEFHEGMCSAVGPEDTAQMNECAVSEADLAPRIDAYFKQLGPYLIDVGAVRTRLEGILPERNRLDAALAENRAKLADLDARFAFHGAEIERALLRLTGGQDRIGEWRAMTSEAQKKALEEAAFAVLDLVLGKMKIENEELTAPVKAQFEQITSLLRRHGAYPLVVAEQARLGETLSSLNRTHDALLAATALKNGYKAGKIAQAVSRRGFEEITLATLDAVRMIAPFQWKMIIGGSKFGAAYLYAVGATIVAEGSVDLESEQMAIHLRAISANQESREGIMAERKAMLGRIETLTEQRAALAGGCPADY